MAKKGEILFWLAMIGMYAFAFTLSPLLNYTQGLRYARPGTEPDPEKIATAQNYETAYFIAAGIYFTIVIAFWTMSYFSTWKLANRYPRLNISVVFEPRYSKVHLGMGMTAIKEIKGSSIETENSLRSVGLRKTFEEIKKEVELKFHGKTAIETMEVKPPKPDDKGKKKIRFSIDDLKREDLNFESFPIEVLHKRDWANFFEEKEIEFFKKQNIKDTAEYLQKSYADLDLLKAKYYNEFKKHRDLGEDQLRLKKCLEFLNKEQIGFLKTMNVATIQDLLNADLEKLNAKYNEQFIKPKTKLLDKFIDAWKLLSGNSDILKQIDFRAMIKFMIEELISKEKNFAVDIDNVEYMKYVQIKATKIRSMFPDKHCYLVEFDAPFQIPASMPEFDFYKQREIEINRSMNQEEMEIDFSKNDSVPIKNVLFLTPVSINECFNYHPGSIDNFGGHTVDCNQMTDVVVRFRGMLTADICILEIRSCDWSINFSAVDSIDWATEEMYNIDMATMLQLVRDDHLTTENLKKSLATEIARVERKEKELEKMWAKKWADTAPEVATRQLLKVEPKPINAFVAVIILAIGIVFLFLGLVLGVFLSPWIGDFFNVVNTPAASSIGISSLVALFSL